MQISDLTQIVVNDQSQIYILISALSHRTITSLHFIRYLMIVSGNYFDDNSDNSGNSGNIGNSGTI